MLVMGTKESVFSDNEVFLTISAILQDIPIKYHVSVPILEREVMNCKTLSPLGFPIN